MPSSMPLTTLKKAYPLPATASPLFIPAIPIIERERNCIFIYIREIELEKMDRKKMCVIQDEKRREKKALIVIEVWW